MKLGQGAIDSLKASPPSMVLGAWFAGVTINEWAALAALLYSLCLIGEKVCGWAAKWHAKRKARA